MEMNNRESVDECSLINIASEADKFLILRVIIKIPTTNTKV